MRTLLALFLCLALGSARSLAETSPVRLAIVGLVHDHAKGFIPSLSSNPSVVLVGIVEPNKELAAKYA